LAVTAHLGSWEIAGAMLSSFGYPVNVVVLPMKDKRTNTLFQSRREQRGFKVIPVDHTVRGIFDALSKKEIVALLGDRDYSVHHHEVIFFGAPAYLPIGPAKLCVRTGAPILPGFLIRRPDDTFLLRLHQPIEGRGLSLEDIQRRIVEVFEKEISENPSQWFIFDEFWKSQP
jgi:KDO2-lipid IV(A) lauroyltransferase